LPISSEDESLHRLSQRQ